MCDQASLSRAMLEALLNGENVRTGRMGVLYRAIVLLGGGSLGSFQILWFYAMHRRNWRDEKEGFQGTSDGDRSHFTYTRDTRDTRDSISMVLQHGHTPSDPEFGQC